MMIKKTTLQSAVIHKYEKLGYFNELFKIFDKL